MRRFRQGGPLAFVLAVLLVTWFGAAIAMNYPQAADEADDGAGFAAIVAGTMHLDRPLLPAPQQVGAALWDGLFGYPVLSPRSLVYHAGVTAGAAALGFVFALLGGALLAIGIVHARTLDRALMPWVVASQTVPILAIAPMVVIVLGNIGLTGLLPKALIAGWLSFFPVTMGLVQGLRSPDRMQLDLLRTYGAGRGAVFAKLRWPAAMAFLFPSLKVSATLCLVGAIVAELPTGAQAGLGARLLTGSYYGQPMQIWSALVVAGSLSLLVIGLVQVAQMVVAARRGGRL
jgi:NitT/TauT family transport system permease protein